MARADESSDQNFTVLRQVVAPDRGGPDGESIRTPLESVQLILHAVTAGRTGVSGTTGADNSHCARAVEVPG